MAIRPVDLQLAYLAAPQNAAQVNNAQNAPQAAQQAAQAAFAAELQKREETVEQTQPAHGSVIQTNPDGQQGGGSYSHERRHQKAPYESAELPVNLAGDGEQFIDVTV